MRTFNLPGHDITHMKFSILEQVKSQDPLYAREREKVLIRKFNTFHAGIIHSSCLERQRTQTVDSLESPVTKVLVCLGSFQKLGAIIKI